MDIINCACVNQTVRRLTKDTQSKARLICKMEFMCAPIISLMATMGKKN